MGIITTRRGFLGVSGGFLLGVALTGRAGAQQSAQAAAGQAAPAAPPAMAPVPPSTFIHIAEDDTVTIISKSVELGQGAMTGIATLIAEELDADWSQIRAELAPGNDALYGNPRSGMQGTGGSSTIRANHTQLRTAGAQARQMLVEAAAEAWGVPAAEISVAKGRITHPSGRDSGFGAFATAANARPVPEKPALKSPDQWVLIGTRLPRLDTADKSTGKAVFALDLYPEGMQVVVIARPTRLGATVASFDDSAARAVPGVRDVRQLPEGVAVYADNTFAALKGRKALTVEWDNSAAETRDTAALYDEMRAAARQPGRTVEEDGDLSGLTADGVKLVEAEYAFPYLAHAPLEALSGVITLADGKADIWTGSQFPGVDRKGAAEVLGLAVDDVTLNVTLAGGAFGRRFTGDLQFARELSHVAKAAGPGTYKVMWTREDDLRGGYYRPMTVHRLRAGVDAKGRITAWENVIANQSILIGTLLGGRIKDGLDNTSYEGSVDLPYDFGGRRVAWSMVKRGFPVTWWRSVGSSHTAFATEMMMDEVFAAVGKDPVQGRLDMLKPDALRERAVIEAVRDMAGWKGSVVDGKGYGVAYAKSFGTLVAQIAEVEDRGGVPHVTRVWCAVDCGLAVNPDVVTAQMQGGIGFGLGAALYNEIRFGPDGAIMDGNFDGYRALRIGEMPRIEVRIIKSDADPGGAGEPGVPPIGPATANAWRALTGTPVRNLPIVARGMV